LNDESHTHLARRRRSTRLGSGQVGGKSPPAVFQQHGIGDPLKSAPPPSIGLAGPPIAAPRRVPMGPMTNGVAAAQDPRHRRRWHPPLSPRPCRIHSRLPSYKDSPAKSAAVTGRAGRTFGCAHVQVHVVVERRAEAVQEGDATEPRAGRTGCLGIRGPARRREQLLFDLGQEDLRERRDGSGPVGEHAAQPLRHRDHPLPHRHRPDDVIGEVGGRLGHVATIAGRADAAALAGEGLARQRIGGTSRRRGGAGRHPARIGPPRDPSVGRVARARSRPVPGYRVEAPVAVIC
jgi:hypothetical protein